MSQNPLNYLVGKTICVGISLHCNNECFYQFQIAGNITMVSDDMITLLPFERDNAFGLPPMYDKLVKTTRDEIYTLKNGNVNEVSCPDYLLTLNIQLKSKDIDISRLMSHGYEIPVTR